MNFHATRKGLALATTSMLLGSMLPGLSGAHAADLRVAVVMSLTGPAAFVGVPATNAMKIAEEDLNAAGFWGDDRFVVTYNDNRTDRQEAITLLNRVASDNETLMYIGPVTTAEALAAAPAANDLKITMYTTGTSPDILAAGPWSFKSAENASDFVKPLGEFVSATLQPQRGCYLVDIRDNVAYQQYALAFAEGLSVNGTPVVATDSILSSDSDFTALATKIVASDADCIYVSTTPEAGANLIVQLRQAGLPNDTIIASTQNAAGAAFINTGGAAVEGTYIIAEFSPFAESPVTADFIAKYQSKYGQMPDTWAAVGYSMMMVAAHSIRAARDAAGGVPTRDQVREAMSSARDIPVVVGEKGLYSVDENRVPHFGAVILQLRDGRPVRPD